MGASALNRRIFLVGAILAAAPWPRKAWADDEDELVVVVHPRNGTSALDEDDLRAIFLTRKSRWKDGDKIVPLNLRTGSEHREHFDRSVLGMSPEESKKYWIDRRIRGGAPPPRAVPSPQAVILLVSNNSNAVGYVPPEVTSPGKVKAVARVRAGEVVAP